MNAYPGRRCGRLTTCLTTPVLADALKLAGWDHSQSLNKQRKAAIVKGYQTPAPARTVRRVPRAGV